MTAKHYLGKLVGPSAVFSGYILLVFGAVATYFSLMAIPLFLLGGILAFSYSEVLIDTENKKYRSVMKLFGFLPVGSWREFQPDDETGLKHFKGSYYAYSRSNRQSSLPVDNYMVYLIRAGSKKKTTLGIFDSEHEAIKEVNRLTEVIRSIKKK